MSVTARESAKDWLRSILANGPVAVERLRELAERDGISWASVRRAQKSLGIKPRNSGYQGKWSWEISIVAHDSPELLKPDGHAEQENAMVAQNDDPCATMKAWVPGGKRNPIVFADCGPALDGQDEMSGPPDNINPAVQESPVEAPVTQHEPPGKSLHEIMWPTPPVKTPPSARVESPGPDIGKIVSGWPKPLRMEYAGRVGRYSNSMPLEAAMAQAFAELRDAPKEN